MALACLALGYSAASAQDAIPPVPDGDLSGIEIPIWESDNPDLRSAIGPESEVEPASDDALAADEPPADAAAAVEVNDLPPLADDSSGLDDEIRAALDPESEGGPAPAEAMRPEDATASLGPATPLPPDPTVSEPILQIEPPVSKATFRVGLVPRGDTGDFLSRLGRFRETLAETLDRPVEVLPMASFAALIDAQALKRVDLAFYSASAFVTADLNCGCAEPLVAPAASDGTAAIHAIVVVRKDSGISAVDDLEGRRVAAAAADSVGGRLYHIASLKEEGLDPETFFSEIADAGSTTSAVLDVRDGIADAAFAWTTFAGDPKAGYSRGTLAYLVASGAISMDDVSIVWQSRPLAHGPVAVLAGTDEGEKALLEAYLTGLSDRDPETYDLLDPYYGGGFQPVRSQDYRGARLLVQYDTTIARPDQSVPRTRPMTPIQTIGSPVASGSAGSDGIIVEAEPSRP